MSSNDIIILPLYSYKNHNKYVYKKSGLNQWHAKGRPRNYNEVYIPIPPFIHEWFLNFFPGRDQPFRLVTTNEKWIWAKVCQDNSKALMSNPNSDLGEWILRDILNLDPYDIVTYDMLSEKGIDSVVIKKVYYEKGIFYMIGVAPFGAYEQQVSDLRSFYI